MTTNISTPANRDQHRALIDDQFTRQAERFAASPALHNDAALKLLVDAAQVKPHHQTLDVACGPGSVVADFAHHTRRSVGLDATGAMLDQAHALARKQNLTNVEWRQGDVYNLPFDDGTFDAVTCRFAFHHLQDPSRALGEMIRVCKTGGMVVLCDGYAADDPAKAKAFNDMEALRDPSTVEFRQLGFHTALFERAGLGRPEPVFYQVPYERETLVKGSFPANDDREALRCLIDASVDGDKLGMNAHVRNGKVYVAYQAFILAAQKK